MRDRWTEVTTSNLKEDSVWFVLHLAARVGLGEATNPIRGGTAREAEFGRG